MKCIKSGENWYTKSRIQNKGIYFIAIIFFYDL